MQAHGCAEFASTDKVNPQYWYFTNKICFQVVASASATSVFPPGINFPQALTNLLKFGLGKVTEAAQLRC